MGEAGPRFREGLLAGLRPRVTIDRELSTPFQIVATVELLCVGGHDWEVAIDDYHDAVEGAVVFCERCHVGGRIAVVPLDEPPSSCEDLPAPEAVPAETGATTGAEVGRTPENLGESSKAPLAQLDSGEALSSTNQGVSGPAKAAKGGSGDRNRGETGARIVSAAQLHSFLLALFTAAEQVAFYQADRGGAPPVLWQTLRSTLDAARCVLFRPLADDKHPPPSAELLADWGAVVIEVRRSLRSYQREDIALLDKLRGQMREAWLDALARECRS